MSAGVVRQFVRNLPVLVVALTLSWAPAVATCAQASDQPVVMTKYGSVRGTSLGSVAQFKGMPYARPPLGRLR